MTQIFHVLPLTAALLVSLLLATDGQIREIYISYVEQLSDPSVASVVRALASLAAAFAGFTLLSAALFSAHYGLSTMRINVIYSNLSNPETGSMLRGLQLIAAICLALAPWLGILAGLYGTQQDLAERYEQIQIATGNSNFDFTYLPRPGATAIAIAAIVLGLSAAGFLDRYRERQLARRVVIGSIPLASLGFFWLLTGERLEPLWVPAVLVVSAVFVLSYYGAYRWLYALRTGFIYTQPFFSDTGINRRRRRRIALFVWAASPWLLIALYVAVVPNFAGTRPSVGMSFPCLGESGRACFISALPAAGRWAMIPVMMAWVAAAGLIVTGALDAARAQVALHRVVAGAIVALVIGVVGISWVGSTITVVELYRALGPLASMALGLLLLFATLALLAVLSQKSGFPALALVVLAIVVSALFPGPTQLVGPALWAISAMFAFMAVVSRLRAVAVVAILLIVVGVLRLVVERRGDPGEAQLEGKSQSTPSNPISPSGPLKARFGEWLDLRLKESVGSQPYPAFIIAVEGGGIYAATAASLFLAKLEDLRPGFSQHVFAISGVSGGAIGATIFQALSRSMLEKADSNPGAAPRTNILSAPASVSPGNACGRTRNSTSQPRASGLQEMVRTIMLDDHFSPVVGAIFPELVAASSTGRAVALSGSFLYSACERDLRASEQLAGSFSEHWSAIRRSPALILNATWAETGSRVAFSPFLLHEGDDSLNSFSEIISDNIEPRISLMDAAVVSARFPMILPPYSPIIGGQRRWNFVDGGYSDSSGASTALALYRALTDVVVATEKQKAVKISVILLTSANPNPNTTSISGTPFRDTIAPVAAVMKVRAGLGHQAVARVCDHFQFYRNCRIEAKKQDVGLKIVEIEDQTYRLPLGWKISQTTFEIVKSMLGEPKHCNDRSAPVETSGNHSKPKPQDEAEESIVQRNSCVLKSVYDSLEPQRRPQH